MHTRLGLARSSLARAGLVLGCVGLALTLVACKGAIFGSGKLFVWNSTDGTATVTLEGRSGDEFVLAPHAGQLIESAVAGPYTMSAKLALGRTHEVAFELKGDRTYVVDVAGAACFARTDISGMYQSGKDRVAWLGDYPAQKALELADPIGVFPGEPVPAARPKSAYVFQRLSEIPCPLLGNKHDIVEHVRLQK